MMKLCEITEKIEKRIPLSWAEAWDNPGLAVGDPDADVSRVAFALDANEDTVSRAADAGCALLVTHHPIIFSPMKTIHEDVPAQKTVMSAIRKGVALYAAHTNWDASPEGVNFCLADALGLKELEQLEPPQVKNGSFGIGAVGKFAAPITMAECMQLLALRWCLVNFMGFGDSSRMISKAAVGGGACGGMWRRALDLGADVFVTADIAYHDRNDALSMGLSLISTDHGEMERAALPALKKIVEIETGLETVLLKEEPTDRIFLEPQNRNQIL
jgi:dinuclear metal center YbgI/SA1388 family protein